MDLLVCHRHHLCNSGMNKVFHIQPFNVTLPMRCEKGHLELLMSHVGDIAAEKWIANYDKPLRFAILCIALILVTFSLTAAAYMPVGKFSPILGLPVGAFFSVFILEFLLRLPAICILVGQFIGHVVQTHRLSGFQPPKWKIRLPLKIQIVLVFIRLAVALAIWLLLILATGTWLVSLIVSVGELPKTTFCAFVLALMWGAFTLVLTRLPIAATLIRDRS
jgi:hypothetical protein